MRMSPFRLLCAAALFFARSPLPLPAQKTPLVWGLVPNAPPTTYVDAAGRPTGFFVELYSRILDELGTPYEFRVASFTELYPRLVSGEIDFFTTLLKNPEREALFVFPDQGFSAGWSQVFVAHGTVLQSVLDLQHKRIGVVTDDRNGVNFHTYIDSLAIPCEIVEYPDFDQLVRAVETGDVFGGVQSNWFVSAEKRVQPTTIVFAPFRSYPVLSRNSTRRAEFDALVERYSRLVADPDSYYYELQRKWLGHERTETVVIPAWLLGALVTLLAASGVSAFVICTLTSRLRRVNADLERKVEERSAQLAKAERLAGLGTLAAGLAHELNSPLQTLQLAAEGLSEEPFPASPPGPGSEDPERVRAVREDYRIALKDSLDRVTSVVQALRVYTHRDHRGIPTVTDLGTQIDAVLALSANRLGTGIRLVRDYAGLPPYRCYADGLQRVWMVLIDNALDAMGEEGTLTVRGRAAPEGLVVSVEDTGPGIPADLGEKVFEPFFTTKPAGEGSGLGLATASEILRSHRGRLAFESRPGRTAFTVTLPAAGISGNEPPEKGSNA